MLSDSIRASARSASNGSTAMRNMTTDPDAILQLQRRVAELAERLSVLAGRIQLVEDALRETIEMITRATNP